MKRDTRRTFQRPPALAVGLAILALAFLVSVLLQVQVTSPETADANGWGYDFEAYFWAAQRVARGDPAYWRYTLEAPFNPGPWGIYMYAPPLAVALMPFTIISQASATALWYVLRVILLAVGCGVMPVRPSVRLLIFAVAAFSQPVLSDLVLGNVSVLVMVLLAFVWRGLDRPMGSLATALAMSIRPTLGLLLIWWALRRRWAAIAWTAVAGIVLILLTLPVVGVRGYEDYVTVLRNVSQVTGVSNNLDLASTVLRLSVNPGPLVATAALYTGYAIAIVAMLASLRFDRELSFMVTIGATLLLAPLLWDHYLATLLLPAAFLAQRGRTWGLALPLLAWLPQPLIPLVAILATLAPFLVPRRDKEEAAAGGPGDAVLVLDLGVSPAPGQLATAPVSAESQALQMSGAAGPEGQPARGSSVGSSRTASPS
jgi:alpha-1,2-mannosyltransferase